MAASVSMPASARKALMALDWVNVDMAESPVNDDKIKKALGWVKLPLRVATSGMRVSVARIAGM